MDKFPAEIKDFGTMFIEMQRQRHEADYNPNATFTQSAVQQSITETRNTISRLHAATPEDLRSFTVYLLLRLRQS